MYIDNLPKKITQEMLKNDEEMTQTLLSEIVKRYYYSQEYVSAKQERLREYDTRTQEMSKEGKLKPQLTHQMKKTFISMFKNEWLTPVFEWFDWTDNELASKLNKIAKFDEKVMRKAVKDEILLWYIFDYWVWFRFTSYYDIRYNVDHFIVADPRNWYPDPNWNTIDNNFDYHFFVIQWDLNELKWINAMQEDEIYCNLDKVTTGVPLNNQTLDKKSERQLSDSQYYQDRCYLYYAFLNVNGRKYRATLANNLTLIIRWEEVKPMSKLEKDNPWIVEFDLAISCPYPLYDDPFGISYRELIIDKDSAQTKIANALLWKELRNAGNDNYLVDADVVRNAHLLAYRPEEGPNYILVKNWWRWVSGAVAPVMDVQNTTQQYSFFQFLWEQAKTDTLLTDIVRGAGAGADTLGQSEMLAQKANINFSLDADMLALGEEMFWRNIWYRNLKNNIIEIQPKIVNLVWSFDAFVKLEKTDFIWSYDPNINVISSKKKKEKDLEKQTVLQSLLPLIQSQQWELPVSTKIYYREIMKLSGFDESFIYSIFKLSPDELHSINMQKIINLWVKPRSLFKPWIDPQVLYIYVNMCLENDIKQECLLLINQQIIDEWLNQSQQALTQQQGGGNIQWIMNSMGSSLLSNNIKQNEQQLEQTSLWL